MYRIPADLDLSPMIGEVATQIRVGRFDVQFTFGPVGFAVWSPIRLVRDGRPLGSWEAGGWPSPGFLDVMNWEVRRWEVPDERRIVIELENGVQIHLEADDDDHECFQIFREGDPSTCWIV